MLDRLRRLLRGIDRPVPGVGHLPRDAADVVAGVTVGAAADAALSEGAYFGVGRSAHYVLEGRTTTLCGRRPTGLHRWSSAWRFVEPGKRCKRCDVLVGDRGSERHGPPTYVDVALFGVEPPGLSPARRAAYRAAWERDAVRRAGDPPPPAGATFSDPPFVYAKDPFRRHGTLESTHDRVLNDVYTRIGNGKKWHRIYETHTPSSNPVLAPYGRSFLFPCGDVGSDFDRDGSGEFHRLPLRTDVRAADEICKACAQSDAKYGKLGDLPDVRWDR